MRPGKAFRCCVVTVLAIVIVGHVLFLRLRGNRGQEHHLFYELRGVDLAVSCSSTAPAVSDEQLSFNLSDLRYTDKGGCGKLRPRGCLRNSNAWQGNASDGLRVLNSNVSQQPEDVHAQFVPSPDLHALLRMTYNNLHKSHRLSGNGNAKSVASLGESSNVFKTHLVQLHPLPEFDVSDLLDSYRKTSYWGGVVTLKDAYVTGEHAMGFDCSVTYFAGGCRAAEAWFPASRLGKAADAIEVGVAVVLAQYYCDAFFHWLIEGVMRLGVVYDFLQANPSVNILHCPLKTKAVQDQFYALFGIAPARVITYKPSQLYFGRRLLYPTAVNCGEASTPAVSRMRRVLRARVPHWQFNLDPQAPDALAAQARPSVGSGDSSISKRTILVQDRGQGNFRSVLNLPQLLAALQAEFPGMAVEVFGPDETAAEAVRKHGRAAVVVAAHGAGLANLIFCGNATVVEIHPYVGNGHAMGRHHVNICHAVTALVCGLSYIPVIAEDGTDFLPLHVPVGKVLRAVRDAIEGKVERFAFAHANALQLEKPQLKTKRW